MITVEEAQARMGADVRPLPGEVVPLMDAFGRVLAEPVVARRTQPPFAASAMDGYAARAVDVAAVPTTLRVVGTVPAGATFEGRVGSGECVRIFTGAPVPDGADAIVIQEDTEPAGDGTVLVRETAVAGRYVRPAGLDFATGDAVLPAGRLVGARDLGLAAAANVPWLSVRRRPRVAILSTGNEIAMPGDPVGPSQIVSSNGPALVAFVIASGGQPIHLGNAPDDVDAIGRLVEGAMGADLLVTTGGVSVGEHDLVRPGLARHDLSLDFWKVAMRPGKPLMFGRMAGGPVLGLPGNPVSCLVCAMRFLRPLIDALLGLDRDGDGEVRLPLAAPVPANDRRQDYLRARIVIDPSGATAVEPFSRQDSSMMARLAAADALVVRPPNAPAAPAGTPVPVLRFPVGHLRV
ncbi:MAG: gephyrin-like molybdotransferase Glp [Rhodospirillales bacterium]